MKKISVLFLVAVSLALTAPQAQAQANSGATDNDDVNNSTAARHHTAPDVDTNDTGSHGYNDGSNTNGGN